MVKGSSSPDLRAAALLLSVSTTARGEGSAAQQCALAPRPLATGMPFNQLGTLAGSKYYNVEATYCYLRW